jgi:DNA repair exonuclease SbcCD ATPase subunit
MTDTERKLQTQVNLLTTTNEVLAERLSAAETAHARDLAAYEFAVENLTAARDIAVRKCGALRKERGVLLISAKYAEHIDATPQNQLQTILHDTLKERDALQARLNQQTSMVEKCIEEMNRNADIGTEAGKERDALAERVKALEADAELSTKKMDALLAHCPDGECSVCAQIICPERHPMHFHHDGCPACAEVDAAIKVATT